MHYILHLKAGHNVPATHVNLLGFGNLAFDAPDSEKRPDNEHYYRLQIQEEKVVK